ncbi:MAG: DUF3786 domain-containing protein [Candidatus Hydrogenedentes bacterium]|nr:DUF3786 domain-containing protein [Candidatus Hydrogenedentota bacterium]
MSIVPVKQTNYELAVEQGYDRACARESARLERLGAKSAGEQVFTLPVMNRTIVIDLAQRRMCESQTGAPVGVAWEILILHYVDGPAVPPHSDAWRSFADFADARGYERVYRERVINRLCRTVGRTRETFVEACIREGGIPVMSAEQTYYFKVFPRLPVMIVRFDGDGELPPGASFVYPDNAPALLPIEDVIVMSECLVDRLQGPGKPRGAHGLTPKGEPR